MSEYSKTFRDTVIESPIVVILQVAFSVAVFIFAVISVLWFMFTGEILIIKVFQ